MKNPKCKKVIEHLESGRPLSKLECFKLYSYWNLGDIVYKLNKKYGPGYIGHTMQKTTTCSEYAVYQKCCIT